MIHHTTPEIKYQSMIWKTHENTFKKAKVTILVVCNNILRPLKCFTG